MLDGYKHLNEDSKVVLSGNGISAIIDIDDIAECIVRMNYGVHRILSALVRSRKEQESREYEHQSSILPKIEKLLNDGYF